MSQVEDWPRSPLPRFTLRNCFKETGFLALFYIWSEKRTLSKSELHSFKVLLKKKKKRIDQQVHGGSIRHWHLGKESYHQSRTSVGVSRRGTFKLYFYFGHSLLLVSVPFCVIIKVDVQRMFIMAQTDYFIA